MSNYSRTIDENELTKILLDVSENKKWLYNRRSEFYKEKWLSICESKDGIPRGLTMHVDQCPISMRVWHGKSYANIIDDCLSCEFCIDLHSLEGPVACCGKTGVKTLPQLKNGSTAKM